MEDFLKSLAVRLHRRLIIEDGVPKKVSRSDTYSG